MAESKRTTVKRSPRKKKPAVKLPPFRKSAGVWDRASVIKDVCEKLCSSSCGMGLVLNSYGFEMPNRTTVLSWIAEDKAFEDTYARAREAQADFMGEELLDIVDNQVGSPVLIDDVPLVIDGKMIMQVDSAQVAHAKLRADNRKWLMAKLMPKKYGDRVQNDVNLTGTLTLQEALALAANDQK